LSQVPPDPLFATAVFACPHENRDVTLQPLLGSAGLPHCIALPPGLGSGGTRGRWVYRDDSGAGNAFLCAILPYSMLKPEHSPRQALGRRRKSRGKTVFFLQGTARTIRSWRPPAVRKGGNLMIPFDSTTFQLPCFRAGLIYATFCAVYI
jgi:hypothetical protein